MRSNQTSIFLCASTRLVIASRPSPDRRDIDLISYARMPECTLEALLHASALRLGCHHHHRPGRQIDQSPEASIVTNAGLVNEAHGLEIEMNMTGEHVAGMSLACRSLGAETLAKRPRTTCAQEPVRCATPRTQTANRAFRGVRDTMSYGALTCTARCAS